MIVIPHDPGEQGNSSGSRIHDGAQHFVC